ncbi:hypothetical protein SS1G_07881 [Sclerotinia sclerotiorum 1980 UF-70]|uniref:Uncharacterized protein n=1 Tax=Sclerotinia sclerotiorum (strain ATCC 18683 / 1980 / Ss-1) TaxID=665079 RepID=A7ERC7_SCLS1|nr:hypothetical protein SS1G_07881 [Sclerotinia sclerotiorum 1980 UF-70]EDN92019.1 hypothetical protein SS1G_07881 [Sclerotinia sclerotiorum 1980 UF-70]
MEINHTRISADNDLGYGLFSTVNLNPGDSIIIIYKPLLLITENQALHRVCANCFVERGEDLELRPCSKCGVVNFCCDGCEKSSLKSGSHRAECAYLKSRKPSEHSHAQTSDKAEINTACAYSRCRSKKATLTCPGCKAVNYCDEKCENLDRSFHGQQCKDVQSQNSNKIFPTAVRATIQLISHPVSITKDSSFMELSSHRDDLEKNNSKWDDLLLQAHALSTNAFRVESNVGNGPIGLCLDPLLARANHCCYPNAAITFDGKRATLRALFPIKNGEQIFISYIDETQRQEVRQAALEETWFFKCRCSRCTNFQSIYENFMTYPTIFTPILDKLVPFQATYDFAKSRVAEEDPNTVTQLFSLLHVQRHIEASVSNAHKDHQNIDHRLDFFKEALGNLNDLILLQRYAQQPLSMLLNEIYLIYLEKSEYIPALIILIFLIHHTDPINYPSPYHPQRVTRLLALQRLLKIMASYDVEILRKFAAENGVHAKVLCEIDWVSACQMVMYALRETGNKCWGDDSKVMRGVEMDIADVEEIQGRRGDGVVGRALREWGGGMDGLGEVYAERLGAGLRALADGVWKVVARERETVHEVTNL